MDPLTIFSLAMAVAEQTLPRILDLIQKGEITVAQQNQVMAQLYSLRIKSESKFVGPEWEVKPVPDE